MMCIEVGKIGKLTELSAVSYQLSVTSYQLPATREMGGLDDSSNPLPPERGSWTL